MAAVHEAIIGVMRTVGAIPKGQKNPHGKYMFRGIDDLYNRLHTVFAEHDVFVFPYLTNLRTESYTTRNDATMHRTIVEVTYTFYHADGSSLELRVPGEAADSSDKSVNQAMSSAFKNAMFQALCIAVEGNVDPDSKSPEMPTPPKPAPAKPKPAPKPAAEADPHAEIIAQYKREAVARTKELGMEPKDGLIVLVDAMRAAGVANANAQNYPGLLVTAYETHEGFGEHLSVEIEKWVPKDGAPGFVEGEA